jgi:hypothetical protein
MQISVKKKTRVFPDILYNPTHFPGPLVCRIRQVPLYFKICIYYLPINLAAIDAPTIMDRLGAMNDILDSTYSNIFSLNSLNSTALKDNKNIHYTRND